ncbi:MAG: LysR family transcriptional regulator [Cellvibrionaceae bacterium]|nr:LysR family transcriptional regulator [Cellvibrionaceae bacterium]
MPQKLNLINLTRLGTIRQLQIYLKVAEYQSIARAAEALFLTQPTVSIQVKKLSQALGLPLYETVGKRMFLTEAGRQVQTAAQDIFATLQHLSDNLESLKSLDSGHLNIAVVTTVQYFMPYFLAPYKSRHPGVEIELHTGNRNTIVKRLKENLDDLYIFSEPPKDLAVQTTPFLPNPIAIIASVKHPLAGKKNLQWQDLKHEHFIMREPGSSATHKVMNYLTQHNLSMNRVMTINSNEAIKHSVMANMGISIMSVYILSNAENDGLVQLDVSGFPLHSQWELIYSKHKNLSPAAQHFFNFVLEQGRELLPMKKIEHNIESALAEN